ncbi:SDR family oxidoreductase [Saccharopolyspora sp. HNM0983]|uniref:SDR family oxidoreductase n=1 Tax=Saccharopolyspora montiporae TaxID=2781240 RepID=A0A929B652_9PSEU|nr:SDR family oxidoreductase [Saccharopolyspora sp. HNM0983]
MTATDGTPLAVFERGDPDKPTILAVHGYPDDHTVWDGVTEALAERFHVVAYDVRGAGGSGRPRQRSAYRLDQLAADLRSVVDVVSPDRPVHLLAHDWGSIQSWHAVTGDELRGRIASFTSISGPCLDHAGAWFRSKLRRPSPRNLREVATQLACSGYIGFFQLPLIPELAWRSRVLPRVIDRLEKSDPAAAEHPTRPATADGIDGLALYRSNMLPRLGRPGARRTDIPVQVIAPTGDPFVTAPAQSGIAEWAPDSWVRRVPGGHWLPRTRPDVVARCATELVDHVECGQRPRSLRRARTGTSHGAFGDRLVVVTGAGNGIGRELALALADRGAQVVAADSDPAAAERTAELTAARGPRAHAYEVDVSDGAAMEDFAKRVRAESGVPDIVVNNAGIGLAGTFADTAVRDWQRVIDVNLWGVIHGSRLFAEQMTARGEGGRIVNIASAAAYLPSQTLSAYGATKAAVLALSQSMGAELAGSGISVHAICPGLVNTGITGRTRFAGTDEAEQADRRQAAGMLYQRRNFTPERAARDILRAVERGKAVAPVTPEAKVGLALSRLSPGLLRALARTGRSPV